MLRDLRRALAVVSLVALCSLAVTTHACMVPKPGVGWTYTELVDRADRIVLATLRHESVSGGMTNYTFDIVEVLRGGTWPPVSVREYRMAYRASDFQGHTDPAFWVGENGRSDFPCCLCGPAHTFIRGETYLLFPGLFGAPRSAEIIRSDWDRWLLYVRGRL